MGYLYDCDHHVENRGQKPEDIVHIVKVRHESWAVFPKTNAIEVDGMVCKEVKDQG